MATQTGTVLSEGQRVELDLGAKTEILDCRVIGFSGTSVVLSAMSAKLPDELEVGRAAYVIVDEDGRVQALRAEIVEMVQGQDIVVSVTDEFQLGQRRQFSRAPIALPARVRVLPDGEFHESATRDISAGGLRIARAHAPCEPGDIVEVVIEAAQAGLRIDAEAEVVRVTDLDLSLRFTKIEPASVVLLQQIALAYYR